MNKSRVPVNEQDPLTRKENFSEVCYGYSLEQAFEEACRCLNCKNPLCVSKCPVGIDIPG
ncbi:MAG TPA: dihydropyrimidine dehydrogenase, partial [Petrotogaceae bacterium]|nr:dihydropyrimidine dehydrogenase [Petrotogaceae bacterium]